MQIRHDLRRDRVQSCCLNDSVTLQHLFIQCVVNIKGSTPEQRKRAHFDGDTHTIMLQEVLKLLAKNQFPDLLLISCVSCVPLRMLLRLSEIQHLSLLKKDNICFH